MIKNYLKIAYRNLRKNKLFTGLNILGLGTGVASCLLIVLYVQDEWKYDRFFPDVENLYRVRLSFFIGEEDYDWSESSALLAPVMRESFPNVEEVVSIFPPYPYSFREGEQVFGSFEMIHADTNFFDFFGYQLLHGNPGTALREPHTLVLTERMARQYAQDQSLSSMIGKTLIIQDGEAYQVTGIMENPPAQTHLVFDGILSLATMYQEHDYFMEMWQPNGITNYVKLAGHTDPSTLQSSFLEVEKQHLWPQMISRLGVSKERLAEDEERYGYYLESVGDIHLQQDGYQLYVTLFSIIGIFILLIACANFINLSTAQATERAREVGVRKVLGSSRKSLITLFLSETLVLSAIAVSLAVLMCTLALPWFNQLTEKQLSLNLLQPVFWAGMLAVLAVLTLLAGSYPAWFMTAFSPVRALKSKLQPQQTSFSLRNVLIVGQFMITAGLVIGTLLVYQQSAYQQQLSPGFAKENVLLIRNANALNERKAALKEQIEQLSSVTSASYSYTVPGGIHDGQPVFKVQGREETHSIIWFNADEDYLSTLGIPIKSGRNFSSDIPEDSSAILINERAAQALALDEPVGETLIDAWEESWHIVGVIPNYHFRSLRHQIEPMLIMQNPPDAWVNYLAVKLAPGDPSSTIKQLEELWYAQTPDAPFDYTFLDQQFNNLFQAEQRLSQVGTVFTLLSVLIACLGLFGLASYTVMQRTKEIGIRKVLGASVDSILLLLTKRYIKLLLIAFVVIIPVANYLATEWLSQFAYRIEIQWWMYALPAVIVLLIALLTISGQTIKAATRNPVDSLRYE